MERYSNQDIGSKIINIANYFCNLHKIKEADRDSFISDMSLRLLKKKDKFDGRGDLSGYLFNSAKFYSYRIIQQINKHFQHQAITEDIRSKPGYDIDQYFPEDKTISETVVYLQYSYGYSPKEIQEKLKLSPSTFRTLKQNGLQRLRDALCS